MGRLDDDQARQLAQLLATVLGEPVAPEAD